MSLRLHFLGTGTSTGVPQLGCHCTVCTSPDPRDRRLRTSALLETPEGSLLFDCGPDFRQQMLSLPEAVREQPIRGVLLTHEHYDHVGGLDDLRPYCAQGAIDIYADKLCARHQRERMPYCFVEHKYPGVPDIRLHDVAPGEAVEVCGMVWRPFVVYHARLPIFAWQWENRLAYITDLSRLPEQTLPQLIGVETLVINALRQEPHPSHQTLDEALDLIRQIHPRQSFLVHASHHIGLHADLAPSLPPGVTLAYDGLCVEV